VTTWQKWTGRYKTLVNDTEQMRAGSKFHVDGAETENGHEVNKITSRIYRPEQLCWKKVRH